MLLCLILLLFSPALLVIFRHQSLHEYPKAVCTDGTTATYFKQEKVQGIEKMLLYLNGGDACSTKEECIELCAPGKMDVGCTARTYPTYHSASDFVFLTDDKKKNPPFFDHFKAGIIDDEYNCPYSQNFIKGFFLTSRQLGPIFGN